MENLVQDETSLSTKINRDGRRLKSPGKNQTVKDIIIAIPAKQNPKPEQSDSARNEQPKVTGDPSDNMSDWPEPIPIESNTGDSMPFPIDGFPQKMKDAINEVHELDKAPLSMIAGSALLAVSTVAQALYDIFRDSSLSSPLSLFWLEIAESGERKTTVNKRFLKGVRDFEKSIRLDFEKERDEFFKSFQIWELEHKAAKDELDKALRGKGGSISRGASEKKLRDIIAKEPKAPTSPILIYMDTTIEGLRNGLSINYPFATLNASEGGVFLGGYSMQPDRVQATLGVLNALWDGSEYRAKRKGENEEVAEGCRLTSNLMIQPEVFRSLVSDPTKSISRNIGFLARCFISHPLSTIGERLYSEPDGMPGLGSFNERLVELLGKVDFQKDDSKKEVKPKRLNLKKLKLSFEAKAEWIEFYNNIEGKMCLGGELSDFRDIASKIAEQAVRVAGCFHVFDEKSLGDEVSLDCLKSACDLVTWYLDATINALTSAQADKAVIDAQYLFDWLKRQPVQPVKQNEILQHIPKRALRKKGYRDQLLKILVDRHWVKTFEKDKIHFILLNPKK
ncbi:MAG: DUF3987 domain-containing protein [SAR324 cluster bacterium]|nr:DUF3987 domain-containing protein [SAR324 cluster bacterium]